MGQKIRNKNSVIFNKKRSHKNQNLKNRNQVKVTINNHKMKRQITNRKMKKKKKKKKIIHMIKILIKMMMMMIIKEVKKDDNNNKAENYFITENFPNLK